MPRPRKRRTLRCAPRPLIYKPAGHPLAEVGRVYLLHEELEALRLAELEDLSQAQAAELMGVSRPTFQRILARARKQVTLALVEGRALQIEGGDYEVLPSGPRRHRRRGGEKENGA